MINCPCKGCRYRHISCHSDCWLYKEWNNETRALKEADKREHPYYNLKSYDFDKINGKAYKAGERRRSPKKKKTRGW